MDAALLVQAPGLFFAIRSHLASLPKPTTNLPADAQTFWDALERADLKTVRAYTERHPEAPLWRNEKRLLTPVLVLTSREMPMADRLAVIEFLLDKGARTEHLFYNAPQYNSRDREEEEGQVIAFLKARDYKFTEEDYLLAAYNGFMAGVEACLDAGVKADALDPPARMFGDFGYNGALHYMAYFCSSPEEDESDISRRRWAITRMVLERGGSIDLMNDKCMTPLAMAIWQVNDTFARFLMDEGASLTAEDMNGHRPLEVARRVLERDNDYIRPRMEALVADIEGRMKEAGIPLVKPARPTSVWVCLPH